MTHLRDCVFAVLLGWLSVSAPALAQSEPAAPPPSASNQLFSDSKLVALDRISVEVTGSGPDVVLIPGLASSRETFRRTAERLRRRFRLHLVQVAGFAGEPARANASGPVLAPTTQAIDDYIMQAGLKRPFIVGHSLGGVMALELAVAHPDHVRKLMIIDTLGFYTEVFVGPKATVEGARPYADRIGAAMLTASDSDFARSAAQAANMLVTAPADRIRVEGWTLTSARPTMVKAMQEDMLTDLRPEMASITVPVTVIYEASLAPMVQADYAPVVRKTLISAAPNAKHFIMYDDPQGFDAALDQFLGLSSP